MTKHWNWMIGAMASCVVGMVAGCAQPDADTSKGGGAFDYADELVSLDQTWTIEAGETVRVGPGTTFAAAPEVGVLVRGILVVEGSEEAPVLFDGEATPRSWVGIEIADGGELQMRHAEIGGATYGIHAREGASYTVEHTTIATSFKVALLRADGSFEHCDFHASGDGMFAISSEVSADDVNGTMTILDASPVVRHSTFADSSPLVDMVRIGGDASPVFDHVRLSGAHCAFHAYGGVNTTPTITNSIIEGMAYGVMAYTAKPRFEGCNFIDNGSDVGFCYGAEADNAPTLVGNYYSSGDALFDASCAGIAVPDAAPEMAAIEAAGPDAN